MLTRAGVYKRLPTEQPNPRTRDIDLASTREIVRRINAEDRRVAPAVARESIRIAAAAELIARSLRFGGRLLFVGAGTSGRIGVLEAAECPPTFNTTRFQVQGVMAGGRNPAVLNAGTAVPVGATRSSARARAPRMTPRTARSRSAAACAWATWSWASPPRA